MSIVSAEIRVSRRKSFVPPEIGSIKSESPQKESPILRQYSTESEPEDWCKIAQSRPRKSRNSASLWENAKGFQADNVHLMLSDLLISSVEQTHWQELTRGIDWSSEDPGPILPSEDFKLRPYSSTQVDHSQEPSTSAAAATSGLGGLLERREGNSVFYPDAVSCLRSAQDAYTTSNETETEDLFTEDGYSATEHEDDNPPRETVVSVLMRYMREQQKGNVLKPEELACLVSYADTPQNLLPITKEMPVAPDEYYTVDGRRIRLRGSSVWAPPKKKFIFDVPDGPKDFPTMLSQQNYRCAGCGLKLNNVYAKRCRLCYYYNELFCQCCHQGAKRRIPARILYYWNFREYPVSDVANSFLAENDDHPVFDVEAINSSLYKKVKNLRKVRTLRTKVSHMWQFVRLCPETEKTLTSNGFLRTMFTSVPSRYLVLENVDVFSLLDFELVENGNLIEMLEPLAVCGAAHIEDCKRCAERGFYCGICFKMDEVIFPFQLDRVHRCEGCGSLSHHKCYKRQMRIFEGEWTCSKCDLIRRKRLRQQSHSSEYNSD